MKKDFKYREIPYNYTSFSDKEIILKYFNEDTWTILNDLRQHRRTGRSAKLLFEVIGDIFVIDRNPYIYNDFIENPKKQKKLKNVHKKRLDTIQKGASGNDLVYQVIDKTREVDKIFFDSFSLTKQRRAKILKSLSKITSSANIHFSAFHKVSHVTDATDWRVEYPEVVTYPENISEVRALINECKDLNLKIIPRGGGTGLTGGVIPVYKNTLVCNLEKFRHIQGISLENVNGTEIPVITLDAGVITEKAEDYAHSRGYIFATDPTSAWASTIGGNIAENCGGKKAVMWGTAIDNIFSFRLVNSMGDLIEIKRRNHPYRKILPEDEVLFDIYTVTEESKQLSHTITLQGTDIRKKGIGKDITNKALGGLPGIQKEGGDGIIVSAQFVLYKPFSHRQTICLEFFGNNLINASQAIVDILNHFKEKKVTFLTALEHFDEKYVLAINYKNKSDRKEIPKAVLLIDVESNDLEELENETSSVISMVGKYNTEGFIAKDIKAQTQFWKDRKNLGAIARHTNAFKLNEDVVIPIEALPEFADFIEMLNLKKELKNNLEAIEEIRDFLLSEKISNQNEDSFLQTKISSFHLLLDNVKELYTSYYQNIEAPVSDVISSAEFVTGSSTDEKTVFDVVREKIISIDIKKDVIESFHESFHGYNEIIELFDEKINGKLNKKIIIATHMHAGDGNIHVNIPVHSNDYSMLNEADETAGVVMEKTKELGGVISGEHGIGLTKLKFIDDSILTDFAAYKQKNDPHDLFNPGKLTNSFPLSTVYTPSLNLLEMEAFILEATDLKDLTTSISACVRCGKCKEVCNTHYPKNIIFYSPRNKILGVSLITEAVLYEAQTEDDMGIRNFKMLNEISNYCTGCHNCYTPCPVNIDFGLVTLDAKKLLLDRKMAHFKAITNFVLFYLKKKNYYINKLFRIMLLKFGYSGQRIAHYINKPFSSITNFISPLINEILKSKLPKAGNKTLREYLKLKSSETFYAFQNPKLPVKKSVVYFPGCGSERMFSEISMATIALLFNAGVRVVIPPEYLCCGYPLLSNGRSKEAENKSIENRVIFYRMAKVIGYMNIKDVVISCGTCHEMLSKYDIDNIFNDSSIIDVNEFIIQEKLYSSDSHSIADRKLLYHDPCHTPLKKLGAKKVFNELFKNDPVSIENCCGEGGTLALSTPHISNALRTRKESNIVEKIDNENTVEVCTTCPSCVQGLSKIQNNLSVSGKSLIQFLAEEILGPQWKKDFIKKVKQNGFERIMF